MYGAQQGQEELRMAVPVRMVSHLVEDIEMCIQEEGLDREEYSGYRWRE